MFLYRFEQHKKQELTHSAIIAAFAVLDPSGFTYPPFNVYAYSQASRLYLIG